MDTRVNQYQRQREDMVQRQLVNRQISDPAVLAAMGMVPRHLFVSEALMPQAYGDFPLPIGEGQTISQPYIVAEMTQALQLNADDRVLEIGTGSGYQAAVLAQIVYRVYTIERIHSIYRQTRRLFDQLRYHNIVTRYADGTLGWPEEAPFDAIIITAGAPDIPQKILQQLAVGGRMVLPVGNHYQQDLVQIQRDENGFKQRSLGGCRFVKLIGENGWEN